MTAVTLTGAATAPKPNSSSDAGFFAYHGIWAPGVRLFRALRFNAKAVIISLAFVVPLLGLIGWQLRMQSDAALQARQDATPSPRCATRAASTSGSTTCIRAS